MDLPIFLAVLCSAFMNAAWNSMVHADADRHAIMRVMMLVEFMLAAGALPFVSLPDPAVWPWLLAGTALRVTYTFVLLRAYARTELSRVYPIARGTAPVVLALFGLAFFGEVLSLRGTLAVVAITAGVLTIARIDRRPLPETRALRYGMTMSAFIAAYSLIDARGVRASGDPFAYAALAFLGESLVFLGHAAWTDRSGALARAVAAGRTGIIAGVLGTLSYLVALWAFTRAPAALVAALRETSVLFAVLLARVSLREKVTLRDWAGALMIVAGAATLRL